MTRTGVWLLLAEPWWRAAPGTMTPNARHGSFGVHGGDALSLMEDLYEIPNWNVICSWAHL